MSSSESEGSGRAESEFFIRLEPGAFVFQEGEAGATMFIIEDGLIELVKTVEGEERLLATLEQGDFFGEMSILEDQPRSAGARAATECQLLRIDKSTFDQMLRQNPEIAVRMLRKLSRRIRQLSGGRNFDSAHEAAPHTDPGNRSISGTMTSARPATRQPETVQLAPLTAEDLTPAVPAASAGAAVAQPSSGPRLFKLIDEATGEEKALPEKNEITVGRPDPVTGTKPDVDLSTNDTMRSVSRRHAKIFRSGDDFAVCEEVGTANGTFVNLDRIQTGVRVPLKDGDHLSFGRVAMLFRQL